MTVLDAVSPNGKDRRVIVSPYNTDRVLITISDWSGNTLVSVAVDRKQWIAEGGTPPTSNLSAAWQQLEHAARELQAGDYVGYDKIRDALAALDRARV